MPPLREGPLDRGEGRGGGVLVVREQVPQIRLLRRLRLHIPLGGADAGRHTLRPRHPQRDGRHGRAADIHDVQSAVCGIMGASGIGHVRAQGRLPRQHNLLHPEAQPLRAGCDDPGHPFHGHGAGGDSHALRDEHRGCEEGVRQDHGRLRGQRHRRGRFHIHRRPDLAVPMLRYRRIQ